MKPLVSYKYSTLLVVKNRKITCNQSHTRICALCFFSRTAEKNLHQHQRTDNQSSNKMMQIISGIQREGAADQTQTEILRFHLRSHLDSGGSKCLTNKETGKRRK